jgi:hypothetical protein
MYAIRNLITGLAIAATTGACAPAASGFDNAPGPQGGPAATVEVENNNWADMTVYVLRGGSRVRLGMVTSMGKSVFRIPASLLNTSGDVRLLADPVGSRDTYTTPIIQVNPGERIEFNIENHVAISNVSVWTGK